MFSLAVTLHAGDMEPGTSSSTERDPTDSQWHLTGGPVAQLTSDERLHRSRRGRMLAGVAAGLADYLGVDPTLVRLAFVALAFMGGLAVPLYLAGWLVIPDEDGGPTVAEELLTRERAR
jgi:phage shock protein PspC (stress-responsive transcriptional regulator)